MLSEFSDATQAAGSYHARTAAETTHNETLPLNNKFSMGFSYRHCTGKRTTNDLVSGRVAT